MGSSDAGRRETKINQAIIRVKLWGSVPAELVAVSAIVKVPVGEPEATISEFPERVTPLGSAPLVSTGAGVPLVTTV